MKCIRSFGLAMALGVSFFAGTAEAATPEEQIDVILNQPITVGDDLEMRLRESGDFAITDLDGNGRLELWLLQANRNGVPEERENATGNLRSAWECIASVPVSRKLYCYEISKNGNKLESIAVAYTDDMIDPNLQYINDAYRDSQGGNTYYDVSTLLRVGDAGYRIAAQVVSLNKGTLNVQTIASEFGNYGIYEEQASPEAVPDHVVDRSGQRLAPNALKGIAADYAAGCEERFRVSVRWHSLQALREAKMQPDGMKALMLDSWKGFSLEQQRQETDVANP